MPVSFFKAQLNDLYEKLQTREDEIIQENESHFLEAFQTYLLDKVASGKVTMDRGKINTILENLGTNLRLPESS